MRHKTVAPPMVLGGAVVAENVTCGAAHTPADEAHPSRYIPLITRLWAISYSKLIVYIIYIYIYRY